MTEQTEIISRPDAARAVAQALESENRKHESSFANISIRAWLAIIVIVTVCAMSLGRIDVKEPLYTLCVTVCAFYFAQKEKPKTQTPQ